jgi:hypothetical protein
MRAGSIPKFWIGVVVLASDGTRLTASTGDVIKVERVAGEAPSGKHH